MKLSNSFILSAMFIIAFCFSFHDCNRLRFLSRLKDILNDEGLKNSLEDFSDDADAQSSGWGQWSSYSPCDHQCRKTRHAYCTDQRVNCIGGDAYGVKTETTKCSYPECHAPVNGLWGAWSQWTSCSTATCEQRTVTRRRKCNNPVPARGGLNCHGASEDRKSCIVSGCANEKYSCSFEIDLCEWNLEVRDHSGWYRNVGPTRSGGTGPHGDHTTGSGYYVYYEASSPAQIDQPRYLYSNTLPASTGSRCLKFWYNMHGISMGTLKVRIWNMEADTTKTLKTISGNHGIDWKFHEETLDATFNQRILFEAIRGDDYRSDIAIDDIRVTDSAC